MDISTLIDLKTLFEGIETLLDFMFFGHAPTWLLSFIAWCIGIGFVLRGTVFLLGELQKLWSEFIQPLCYKPEDAWRRSRRQKYADSIEAHIKNLNTREAWNDNRFAELEAEVEAEGRKKLFDVFRVGFSPVSRLRKEKSLSSALERSTERLILVEGDPGSGKSVALRHLTQNLANRVSKSRNLGSVIPLYINLKGLKRLQGQTIDQNLIHAFILKTLTSSNDRDVEDFLAEEFEKGLKDGTWLFLFDSFDEIPDILSSTESDDTIRAYAEAISDFLHGMNKCRGIVASREYKGPRFLGWPKFRILPLTLDRKRELIRKTNLSPDAQKNILIGISQSATDFRYLTGNPMFLNLLCEFMHKREVVEFPKLTHLVFDDYIWKRLKVDEERLKRFSKTPGEIRDAAERLAFCMTADKGIGLSPTVEQLETSTRRLNLDLGDDFPVFIEALKFLKLAHIDESAQDGTKNFTFAHRRFQEYFATAVVLREPERVDVLSLLTNARWRETAVVILQTQSLEKIAPIFSNLHTLLKDNAKELQENVTAGAKEKASVSLPAYSFGRLGKGLFENFATSRRKIEEFVRVSELFINANEEEDRLILPIIWPKNLYHVLGILQEGLSTKYDLIPEDVRQTIDNILLTIIKAGGLDDRKWALEVVGSASLDVIETAIDIGFSSPGSWVKNPAILQVSRLPQIPQKFSKHIISNLLMSAQEQTLFEKRYETFAQFSRFPDTNFLNAASLIVWMPFIDFTLVTISSVMVINLILSLINSAQGELTYIFSLIFVLFFSTLGIVIRWLSSNILKAIVDTYSARLGGNSTKFSNWFTNRFRVKPPKHSDKSLIEKLMSLMMGTIFSGGGVLLFIFANISAKGSVNIYFLWGIFVVFTSLQFWFLAALVEVFRLKRTSVPWRVLYLFYPIAMAVVAPYFFVLYLADHVYLWSRAPIAIQVLKKSPIKNKLIPFIYRGNHYMELWLPITLMIVLIITLLIVNLTAMVALWFVLGLILFEVVSVFYLFISPIVTIWKERTEYKNAKAGLKSLDVLGFVSIVDRFSTKRYRMDLIYTILDKQYMVTNPANISRLRILIAFLQTALASQYNAQNFKYLLDVDRELAMALGCMSEEAYKATNYWDEDQLDMICKLLEQVQRTSTKES